MDWNGCLSTMQRYLENSPLIVLGSGASMPYGLPSMGKLAEQIKSNDVVKADPSYNAFCASLSSEGLEKAIDSVSLNKETINAIRTTIWKNVNDSDFDYLKSNAFSVRL